jgi:nucleotide-binding universal stress UspA family protein
MFTLRTPTGPAALAALRASERAGFLGSVLLLSRRLEAKLENELRESWSDLDDLTHDDLLVLVTGLETKSSARGSAALEHHEFAGGITLTKRAEDRFEQCYEELLGVSAPVPKLPPGVRAKGRLLESAGVTEIRRELGMAEQELPILLVRAHTERREAVVRLANGQDVFSPARVITQIAMAMDSQTHGLTRLVREVRNLEESGRRSEADAAQRQLDQLKTHRGRLLFPMVKFALNSLGFEVVQSGGEGPSDTGVDGFLRETHARPLPAPRPETVSNDGTAGGFDVFLSFNSGDRPAVRGVAERLRAQGLRVWFDEWELVPGRPWAEGLEEAIQSVKAAAVFVGSSGLGPWEMREARGFLDQFVRRKLPVIPVLLPGLVAAPRLPLFLEQFAWVDLRPEVSKEGLARLVWGITGRKSQ